MNEVLNVLGTFVALTLGFLSVDACARFTDQHLQPKK